MMCSKCKGITAWLMLIFGILFLLVDLKVWNFWGIQWWTVLFLVFGIATIAHGSCPECQAMMKKK